MKVIDGKKYIEYNEQKVLRNRTIINSIFLILLFVALVFMFIAIQTIIKNKEMLQNEPLSYVMYRYNMVACGCLDSEGEEWYSGEVGFLPHYEESMGGDFLGTN